MTLPWTIAELSNAIASGRCSAVEAVGECFRRVDLLEGKLHALVSLDRDRAMTRAKQIDEKVATGHSPQPLTGVPIAVKDNICTSFGVTT